MKEMQPACSSECRMTGEGKLFVRREDADTHAFVAVAFRILRRNYEGCFGEVGLTRDGLHLCVGEAATIVEDSEWIALEWMLGKDIENGVIELARHDSSLGEAGPACLIR